MSTDKPSQGFAALFEAEAHAPKHKKTAAPKPGARVKAEVVQIGKEAVFVEIVDPPSTGKRVQAFVERPDLTGPDGELSCKSGDVIEAIVISVDGQSGEVRLGRGLGKPAGLAELETAYLGKLPVEGKVAAVNKGGLEVEIAGVRAFCPMSQVDRTFTADPQALVGRSLEFIVTELQPEKKRIVVSRRALLEREAKEAQSRTLSTLTIGAVVRGSISAVRDFGAFVDLGGIEGLIPNSELSFDRGAKAGDVLNPGDVVEVQVRDIKTDVVDKRGNLTTKVTLSLKALASDPWDGIDLVAPEGKVVRGSVSRVVDFGAFIRLASGIEGLLHVSELDGKVQHPSAVLKVGETLNVVVRAVDRAAKKISLAPAAEGLDVGAEARKPAIAVGSIVQVAVDHIETFGVFVQVEGTRGRVGRGLVPNAELGTPRGSDTRKLFPVGTKLTAKVLETGDGRLRMSLKAVKEDEERADFDGYRASVSAGTGMGTLGDLLSGRKGK